MIKEWDNPEFVANKIKEKGLKETGKREGLFFNFSF